MKLRYSLLILLSLSPSRSPTSVSDNNMGRDGMVALVHTLPSCAVDSLEWVDRKRGRGREKREKREKKRGWEWERVRE